MDDVGSSDLDIDTLTASIRADSGDLSVFYQVLGSKLADALPQNTVLQREGGGLFRKKEGPIKVIRLTTDNDVFEAEWSHGMVVARHSHAVRGITLKNEELEFDAWLRALVEVLAARAQKSAQARAALQSLVT